MTVSRDSDDSLDNEAAHKRAAPIDTSGLHIVVSLADRSLVVVDDGDTLRTASVGVGMDSTLTYEGKVWRFQTPPGIRRVIDKVADPKWAPPEWHYVEIANARNLRLVRLPAGRPYVLPDSSKIVVRDGDVGLIRPGELFRPFAEGEEIIWDSTLYIPPLGTRQRRVIGELGRYRLDLGNGYLLHGTPHTESIGQPSSHGCLRLGDEDIEWLYENIPVGTPVVIR
jgi:lipoprotein-anchoring transpeptidase ErfK/SrfK